MTGQTRHGRLLLYMIRAPFRDSYFTALPSSSAGARTLRAGRFLSRMEPPASSAVAVHHVNGDDNRVFTVWRACYPPAEKGANPHRDGAPRRPKTSTFHGPYCLSRASRNRLAHRTSSFSMPAKKGSAPADLTPAQGRAEPRSRRRAASRVFRARSRPALTQPPARAARSQKSVASKACPDASTTVPFGLILRQQVPFVLSLSKDELNRRSALTAESKAPCERGGAQH
jgi:hypothetical protein